MSEKLKIKLSIANRVYPLTIEANQEEGLRKAAKKIEAMIKKLELFSVCINKDNTQVFPSLYDFLCAN